MEGEEREKDSKNIEVKKEHNGSLVIRVKKVPTRNNVFPLSKLLL
jgi:ribosomal 30S subunit maturation factor RimM